MKIEEIFEQLLLAKDDHERATTGRDVMEAEEDFSDQLNYLKECVQDADFLQYSVSPDHNTDSLLQNKFLAFAALDIDKPEIFKSLIKDETRAPNLWSSMALIRLSREMSNNNCKIESLELLFKGIIESIDECSRISSYVCGDSLVAYSLGFTFAKAVKRGLEVESIFSSFKLLPAGEFLNKKELITGLCSGLLPGDNLLLKDSHFNEIFDQAVNQSNYYLSPKVKSLLNYVFESIPSELFNSVPQSSGNRRFLNAFLFESTAYDSLIQSHQFLGSNNGLTNSKDFDENGEESDENSLLNIMNHFYKNARRDNLSTSLQSSKSQDNKLQASITELKKKNKEKDKEIFRLNKNLDTFKSSFSVLGYLFPDLINLENPEEINKLLKSKATEIEQLKDYLSQQEEHKESKKVSGNIKKIL